MKYVTRKKLLFYHIQFFLDVPVYENFYKINAVLVTIREFLLKYKIVMYPHFDLYIYIYIYIYIFFFCLFFSFLFFFFFHIAPILHLKMHVFGDNDCDIINC